MHIIVITVPNFYRALPMDFLPKRQTLVRTSKSEERRNREEGEKYSLGKGEKNGGYCNCQPNGVTCLGNLFLGKPTGSNW